MSSIFQNGTFEYVYVQCLADGVFIRFGFLLLGFAVLRVPDLCKGPSAQGCRATTAWCSRGRRVLDQSIKDTLVLLISR